MPDQLPFEWTEERDGDQFWFWDQVHCPVPYSPLSMSAHAPLIAKGTDGAAARMLMPFDGTELRFLRGYLYNGARPLKLPEDEFSKRLQANLEIIRKAIFELPEQWELEWLPELDSFHDFQKKAPLKKFSWAELDSYRRRSLDIDRRRWTIHFTFWYTFGPALELYLTRYRDLLGEPDDRNAYTLLQGFENRTTQTDQEVWKLAASVERSSELRALFEQARPQEIFQRLDHTKEGKRFKAALDRFLTVFGYRTASYVDIADVTWVEDPAPVFITIQQCLRRSLANPKERQEVLARERENALARLRPKIEPDNEFLRLLTVLQKTWPVTESHQFYLDQPSIAHAHLLYMEYGRRFAEAGSLSEPNDVFYLVEEELLSTSAREGKGDLGSLVAGRKKLMEEWRNFQPPPFLGKRPPGEERTRDLALERVFGVMPEMERETGPEIHGIAGAPGKTTGVVRVLQSPALAADLKPGEILVAKTTTPAWTSLFGQVAALVTDSGGVLCHGAVVAREYGIPAVVGTREATELLKDGDMVVVDGTVGKVTILGRPS